MTVWYARQSTVNINVANMWNDKPDGTGNWLTWASLASGDILCANAFINITINVDVNVGATGRLSNDAEVGPNGTGSIGGGFLVSSARTITASIFAGGNTAPTCLNTSGSAYTLVIIGNVTAGVGNGGPYGINNPGAVNITITGNVTGGTSASSFPAPGISSVSSGTIIVNGNVSSGPTGTSSAGIQNLGSGAVTVTGNVTALTSPGIVNSGTGVVTINSGNLINSATKQAVDGLPSVVYNPGPSNYIRCPKTGGTADFALESAANVRSGTPYGDVVGTMAVPTAAQVLYNVPVDNTVGAYVEATAAQVQSGVNFGPSSSYVGILAAGGGPLVGAGGLVD